jgi:hypothetical protein
MFIFFVLLLPAILFPVFSRARESARRAACVSNLKQLGMATIMYTQDYDEKFPKSAAWMDEINPYTKREQYFHCLTASQSDPAKYGYAYDRRLSGKKWKDITSPAQTIMQFDSVDLAHNAAADASSPGVFAPRHTGPRTNPVRGYNQVMADGSVIFVPDQSAGSAP